MLLYIDITEYYPSMNKLLSLGNGWILTGVQSKQFSYKTASKNKLLYGI